MVFVIVTGHLGFIGRNVYRHLMNEGFTCQGFDIKNGKDIRNCSLPSCDLIVHLAGLAGVRKSHESPEEYWSVNVDGSRRIFEHAQKWNAKVIYASSSSAKQWWTSPYATTKKAVEAIAPEGSVGLRFHTVYGHNSRPDMMYRKLIDDTATYCTRHTRDFTHVNDVVSAIVTAYNNYEDMPPVIDVGSGNPVAVGDLAAAAGRTLPYKEVTGEQESSLADISVLKQLGWQPRYNVLDEIKNDLIQKDKMEKFPIDW